MTKEEKLKNLSYESDGKMGKENSSAKNNEELKEKEFFNVTQDSE